ncbi:hypothetical protein ACFL1L_02875 [Thermoplasmatota archaeon]
MRNKIFAILISMLFIFTILSVNVFAGSEEDPEITDEEEDDVQENFNIISAWFYEKEEEPDYLYTALKLKNIDTTKTKQHLVIIWEHEGVHCSAGLYIGYDEDYWLSYQAGYGHGFWFQEHYQQIEGEFDEETGIITCKIPKNIINEPDKGDILTKTRASAFQRFGFIGMLGFDRLFIRSLIFIITGKSANDFAPNDGYGRDYIIQY